MSDDEEFGVGHRYAYLLQPIRDLSKNWDVDIAGVLVRYIEELHTADGDPRDGRFNFAEAAMLIQGTTCVYGRKVEYLYQLVLQTKELLANRKKQKDDNNNPADEDNNAAGGDDDDRELDDLSDPEELKSFDKLKPGKGVELKQRQNVSSSELIQPLVPMALIPLADFEKSDVPLVSRAGELIGKKDDFRVNNCHVHPQGPLLLDLANENLLQDFVEPDVTLRPPDQVVHIAADAASFDDDGGGAGGDTDCEGPTPMEMERDGAVTALGDHLDRQQRGSVTLLKVGEHQRRGDRRATALTDATDKSEPEDPFAELDPFDVLPGDKKIKVGKSFRFPDQIEKTQQRKRKANGDVKDSELESVIDFIDRTFYSRSTSVGGAHKWPVDCAALDDYFYKEYKRRLNLRRTWTCAPPPRKRGERIVVNAASVDESDGDVGAFDDDDEDDGLAHLADNDNEAPILNDEDLIGPAPDDVPESHVDHVDASSPERPNSQMSYEDQLKFHLNKYWSSACEHLTTSALARRVQQWEKRIAPKLEQENSRRPFDVHQYGSEILERFEHVSDQHTFDELMGGENRFERCRYFLSSLMMANTLNVEIADDHERLGMDAAVNKMRLKLLKRDRHHTQFDRE